MLRHVLRCLFHTLRWPTVRVLGHQMLNMENPLSPIKWAQQGRTDSAFPDDHHFGGLDEGHGGISDLESKVVEGIAGDHGSNLMLAHI